MTGRKRITTGQAFREAVHEAMAADPRILVMGTDLFIRGGHFAQVRGLGEEYGRGRIRDAPISEAALVAAGVGAALNGLRPIVDLNFVDFSLGAMDEIVNQAAKMRYMSGQPVPLIIRASYGVAFFASQHNNSLEGFFTQVPGLVTVAPSTPGDIKGLLKSSLRSDDPVVFLMHKRLTGYRADPGSGEPVSIGSAAVARPGDDVSIITFGVNVRKALEAANALESDGVSVEVVDLRTLSPLDMTLVGESIKSTGRVLVVTESPPNGFGAQLSARIHEVCHGDLVAPLKHVSAPNVPIPHSPPLIEALLPDVNRIAEATRHLMDAG